MSEYYKESILFKFWEFYKESKKNIWQVSDQWNIKCNQKKKKSFKTYPLNTWNFCFIQAFTATEGLNPKDKMEENVYVQNRRKYSFGPYILGWFSIWSIDWFSS